MPTDWVGAVKAGLDSKELWDRVFSVPCSLVFRLQWNDGALKLITDN
jgi:hypothetical protein